MDMTIYSIIRLLGRIFCFFGWHNDKRIGDIYDEKAEYKHFMCTRCNRIKTEKR